MRATAGVSRLGLLLALLWVLVGVSPDAGPAVWRSASATGASVSTAQSTYDEPQDRPRGSVTAGHSATTAAPDTWWVVWQRPPGECAPHGRTPAGEGAGTGTATAAPASRSSRAPPRA